ncbi:baseplate J/gp47 family protein, partial [Kribbia dieselivorans]|uniref:baseplate J/gp47 family protein n=1 Tax=Kribbia dieselivorans TaxID=331526 RepID=UPI00157AB97B
LPGGRTRLDLAASLTRSYRRSGALVLGNVARATHGETIREVLGSGDARRPFQSFTLKQGPLTFVPTDTPTGSASTLEVSVDGLRWRERVSTYGAAPHERVFVTRDEPDGTESVVFGDGRHGARLPSGSANVRARYRIGAGAAGNLRVGQVSQALDRPLGLSAVTNPLEASGGVDPETEASARRSIPRPVRTLGRAVSLLDYADFALALPGIGQATAVVLPLRGGRGIVVTISDPEGGPPATAVVDRVRSALVKAGDPQVRAEVVPVRLATFRVGLRVAVDPLRERPEVFAAVEDRLRSTYRAAAREI